MKIRLSRRVVPSARVNLNSYWNKFEEMSTQNLSLVSLEVPSTCDVLTNPMRQLQMNHLEENQINESLHHGKE